MLVEMQITLTNNRIDAYYTTYLKQSSHILDNSRAQGPQGKTDGFLFIGTHTSQAHTHAYTKTHTHKHIGVMH